MTLAHGLFPFFVLVCFFTISDQYAPSDFRCWCLFPLMDWPIFWPSSRGPVKAHYLGSLEVKYRQVSHINHRFGSGTAFSRELSVSAWQEHSNVNGQHLTCPKCASGELLSALIALCSVSISTPLYVLSMQWTVLLVLFVHVGIFRWSACSLFTFPFFDYVDNAHSK